MLFFFGGNSDAPYPTSYGMPILRMCAGRAAALRDRFVRVSACGPGPAGLLTAPLSVPSGRTPLRLEVNARLSAGAELRVALAHADRPDEEVPGCGPGSARVLAGDCLAHRVGWPGGEHLPAGWPRFRVRLQWRGAPQDAVYGFVVRAD